MSDDLEMFFIDLGCAAALLVVAVIGTFIQLPHSADRLVCRLGAALPFVLYSGGGRSLTFQLGSMLSGGVMLSAGLCHLLAEAVEVLQERVDFPLGPFLCAVGYLVTLIIDQVAESYMSNKAPSRTAKPDDPLQESLTLGISLGCIHSLLRQLGLVLGVSTSADSNQADAIGSKETVRIPIYTVAVLALSLSFHSVLEGLALGTEDDTDGTVDVFIATVSHKGLAAYALGACVIESAFPKRGTWVVLGTFCLASPVGVMVGYIISTYSDSVTSASLSAAASGTFLYVALMEIISRELEQKEHKIKKIIALVVGFTLMSCLTLLE